MTHKVYHNKAQASLHHQAVMFIEDLIKAETAKFMEIWYGKNVTINNGGAHFSGGIIDCKVYYTYGDGNLEYHVTLRDFNNQELHLIADDITELTEKQYALACLKKQLESFPWSEDCESELFNLKKFADQLDIDDIITTKKHEASK